MNKLIVAVIVGAVLGIIGARYLLVGSWLNLVPWTVAGIAVGYWGTRTESVINSFVYGFVLSFAFLAAGYSGKFPFITRVPFFAVLGVVGGICGLGTGLVGVYLKSKLNRPATKNR
ncbi:MAG TPA: hypothetical protein VI758_04915 [Bacteroidota bacterium]